MSSIDRIEKLTGQYEKEMELAEKHRNRGKEHMELAEKHTKKAGDLEKQIKYEKGGEVFDRVNALNLTPEELQLILQLLDDRTQLMDAVRKMFPERLQMTWKPVRIQMSPGRTKILEGILKMKRPLFLGKTRVMRKEEKFGALKHDEWE